MNASELRERDDQELQQLEEELTDELFRLRMQHHTGQLEDTAALKKKRRNIARIKTVLRERELDGSD